MTLFFIEESKEKNRYKFIINNILNKIEEKKEGNKFFLILPIKENTKPKKIKKLIKGLEKYNIKNAILSDKIYNIENLKNGLYARNINILDGRYLFQLLIEEIINYICKKSKKEMAKTEISICTNDASNINKEIICELAEKAKTLNIITNHINEFKKLEEYLYNEKGILIKLSNNYKTALQKTNIIINMDFAEEIINKFSLPNKCLIINIRGEIKIKSKKFNGINVNDYNIISSENYKIEGFNDKFIYEGKLLGEEYKVAKKQILEDKIQIKNLIGENGKINNREFSFFS